MGLDLPTDFRAWVNNLWVENCREHDEFGEPQCDPKEYFSKYKWWLKREFKHQQSLKDS